MLKPETELFINRLSDARRTSFEWIIKRDREGSVGDFAEAWAELAASALQDVRGDCTTDCRSYRALPMGLCAFMPRPARPFLNVSRDAPFPPPF